MRCVPLGVLVLSLPKSGSSMVFQSLCEAFPDHPTNMERLADVQASQIMRGMVCKQVFQRAAEVRRQRDKIVWFDRIVTLVRDPRDRLVSAMLYAAYDAVCTPSNPLVTMLPALVARKERMPSAVSCFEICRTLGGNRQGSPEMGSDAEYAGILAETKSLNRPLLSLKYEQLLTDEGWERLTGLIGYPVPPPRRVTPVTQRVRRSARSGDWRHWFTPEDVEVFRPLFADMINRLGYDPDWTLASPQQLDPQYGSEFVRQCIDLRLRSRAR